MSYTKTEGKFLSSDKKTAVGYFVYTPDVTPFAVLQISHGMCECTEKYENNGFIDALISSGIVVCGNDHIGHGVSVSEENEAGYVSDYRNIVSDLHTLNGIMRKTYRSLPYVLYGNGIGGCAVRSYVTQYDDIDGVVISGTPSDNIPHGIIRAVSKLTLSLRGEHYKSKLLRKLMLSELNQKFGYEKDGYSWLTSDAAARAEYGGDGECSFMPAAAYYREFFKLLSEISDSEWESRVPLSLPVFLASGTLDPVSDFGEGTRDIHSRLGDAELNELKIKLYDGCRHDILHEEKNDEFLADVTEWIKEVADGVVACRSYGTFGFGAL